MNFLQSAKRTATAGALALVTAGLLSISSPALASQANPNAFVEKQPDGSRVTLRIKGDENFHWYEDTAGYSVVQNGKWYEYARLDSAGKLAPSGLIVGRVDPAAAGLQKHTLPSLAERAKSALKIDGVPVRSGVRAQGSIPPVGTVKNLVVMIQFADHTGRTLPSVADIDKLFNAVGGDPTLAPTGSVRDVYTENSYGQMTLVSTPSGWVTVSGTEASYGAGNSGLGPNIWPALTEALTLLDASVDFTDYDMDSDGYIDSITFIHSGYGAEWGGTDAYGTSYTNRIWSHRWAINAPPGGWISLDGTKVYDYHISPGVWGTSGSAIGRIGVIAHETGHFFGLPDFYDTNGVGEGTGSYELMANSWGFDGTQYCPPHFSPFSKTFLGWYTPTVISAPGTYTANQAETNAQAYKITTGFPSGEYLLVENRQDVGFDCSMPQGGLVIYHIDEAKANNNDEGYPGQVGWPTNNKHYRVAVLQADGLYGLEKGTNRGDAGDVHHAGGVFDIGPGPGGDPNTDSYQGGVITTTGIAITDISASGAAMTFCLQSCTAVGPQISINDVAVTEGNSGTKSATFTVTLSEVLATGVTFKFSTADGTATAGSDYVARSLVAKSIPAGMTTATFNITLNGDTSVESNETFFVNLTNVVGAGVGDAQGQGTIINNDVPMLTKGVPVTGLGATVGNTLLFGFNVPPGKTGVTFTISGGTGDADMYVRFGQYPTTGTYDCRPFLWGNAETCTFSPGQPGTYYVLLNAYETFADVSLVADYSPIYLSVSDVSLTEGTAGTKVAAFMVNLAEPSASNVTFNFATADGTAVAGSDYVARTLTARTIPAGSTSIQVGVNVNGDTAIELNENFYLNVSSVVGAIASDAQGRATIVSDDLPTLSINDVSVTEGNSGTKVATFTVTMSQATTIPVTFDFSTANGTATGGTDYVIRTASSKTIPAGSTSVAVGIVLNGDVDVEANETYYVNLSNPNGAAISDGQGLGTIVNND